MKEKNKAKNILKEYATITVGMFIVSASVYYLMMPNSFVVGSISGLVMVLANFIPLKVSTMTMILNVALLIIGIVFVGKEFGGKTVITSLMLPVYLRIFETVTPDVPPLTDDMFINMLCHKNKLLFSSFCLKDPCAGISAGKDAICVGELHNSPPA